MKYSLTLNSRCLDIWKVDETDSDYRIHVIRFRGRPVKEGWRLSLGSWWIADHTIAESDDKEELTALAAIEALAKPPKRWIWKKR